MSQVASAGGRSGQARPFVEADEAASEPAANRLRVIDLLREYSCGFVVRHRRQAPPQVRSVLAKLSLCRTKALRGHTYKCPRCLHETQVYNSCTDRHCPLCSGAKRADWLGKTAQLLLPGINYFQVVFTLPDALHGLMLGNRRETFNVLFRAAWASLRDYLARYMTGGPISDNRLISHENDEVTFWARSNDKRSGNPSRPFPLSGIEFTRRWALHILPKGFTKVRRYGGYSGRLCRDYLDCCRERLGITDDPAEESRNREGLATSADSALRCPNCDIPLEHTIYLRRPSWKKLFDDYATCPIWHGHSRRNAARPSHRPREPDGST